MKISSKAIGGGFLCIFRPTPTQGTCSAVVPLLMGAYCRALAHDAGPGAEPRSATANAADETAVRAMRNTWASSTRSVLILRRPGIHRRVASLVLDRYRISLANAAGFCVTAASRLATAVATADSSRMLLRAVVGDSSAAKTALQDASHAAVARQVLDVGGGPRRPLRPRPPPPPPRRGGPAGRHALASGGHADSACACCCRQRAPWR